jgi:hypothetical protein
VSTTNLSLDAISPSRVNQEVINSEDALAVVLSIIKSCFFVIFLVFNNNDISILANELKIPLETTTEVDVILKRYLKDSMPKYLSAAATRALIQIASKEAFSRSARGLRKYDGGATQLIGTALIEKIMLSSEPSVRTWSSLPSSIQMARFSLDKEKDNILRINLGSKSETIKVNTNKNYQLISIRVVGDEKYLRVENNNISEGNDYFNSIIKYAKNQI